MGLSWQLLAVQVAGVHQPYLTGLLIRPQLQALIAPKVGGVDPVRGQAEDLGQALPGHGDGALLEVIAKAPVALQQPQASQSASESRVQVEGSAPHSVQVGSVDQQWWS